jgi:hypothetical protein
MGKDFAFALNEAPAPSPVERGGGAHADGRSRASLHRPAHGPSRYGSAPPWRSASFNRTGRRPRRCAICGRGSSANSKPDRSAVSLHRRRRPSGAPCSTSFARRALLTGPHLLGGALVPSLVSVTGKIDRPNHKPAIFLTSPCGVFGIHQALDFWRQSVERVVLSAFDPVKAVRSCNATAVMPHWIIIPSRSHSSALRSVTVRDSDRRFPNSHFFYAEEFRDRLQHRR